MDFVLDAHCHTTASGHAYSSVKDYAEEASAKGLTLIAITDHAPKMPGSCHELHFLNLKILPEKLFGVEILPGVELNILDRFGRVDLSGGLLKHLAVVIASLHIPCIPPGSVEENTAAVVNAMKNPLIKIIGHLGDPRYPMDIQKVVRTAKETGTVIEINEVSLNPASQVRKGGEKILKEIGLACVKNKVPVVCGSDSHFYTYIGDLKHGKSFVEELNFPPELVLNYDGDLFKKHMQKK